MPDKKNILIVGGGYAGVEAAQKLAKRFKKRPEIEITLVDRNPYHTLMTELHEVAGHRVEPDAVRIPFDKLFGASKVKFVVDSIDSVDFEARQAVSSTAKYAYDYLVLGSGAQPEYFGIKGVQENSFTLWSFDDAMRIREHIERSFEKALSENDAARRKRMLSFVVAGAGFTGIEMAGELLEWRDVMCRKWLVDPAEVSISVVEAMPHILPIFEEDLRAKVERYLERKNVRLLVNAPIVGAEPGRILLKDGTAIETDTFIWTCGVQGSAFADALPLAKGKRKGRLQATAELRSPDYPEVFIVGDNLWLLEDEKPLPQIVETAMQTADLAAHNIAADIEGKAAKSFKSNFHGFMVSVGGRYAVSNAGGMKMSGFFAMAMKHAVNLLHLFGVVGVNQCWEYIKHEFLDMRNGRSLLRGFGEYKNRGYWLVPIRFWLGLMWVMEGVNKIGEGWLNWASGSKSWWMFSPGVVQAGVSQTAQAVSAASEAAEGTVAVAADAVSAASEWAEGAEAVAEGAVAAFAKVWDLSKPIFDMQGGISTWFRTLFMDGMMAYLPFQAFQLFVVLAEIAIGLALFGGLFTWFAAVASIGMCLIFTLSGMFAWDQLWFVFAAILLMGGGGRAFGLDCWVVPFCKRWWNGTRFARSRRWYLDGPSRK